MAPAVRRSPLVVPRGTMRKFVAERGYGVTSEQQCYMMLCIAPLMLPSHPLHYMRPKGDFFMPSQCEREV
eukprot:5269216-Pyramimonas_sp.AAC.1